MPTVDVVTKETHLAFQIYCTTTHSYKVLIVYLSKPEKAFLSSQMDKAI